MEKFVKGDIVVFPFPFSDLSDSKKRPALVLSSLEGEDLILCLITSSQIRKDKYSLPIDNFDFLNGKLTLSSLIRANRLFTASQSIIKYKIGSIKNSKLNQVLSFVCDIIKN